MYSAIVFHISVICLFSTVYSIEYDTENDQRDARDKGDCSLWVPENDTLKMPIAFTSFHASIIYPDDKGRLNVKRMHSFKLSCASAKFASRALHNNSEALVTCDGGNSLVYDGRTYEYADFRCDAMPKSELRVTGDTCQSPDNYTVAVVGFQTKRVFLNLYKVCFDKSTKNSLYTWYDARSPYYNNHQKMSRRPPFVKTKELYGTTDVNRKYTFNEQKKTVAKILRSDDLADKYIKNDKKHSLSRGHYAAKADFFFPREQSATFYYANVAPQWQIFNGKLWSDLEETTRRKMDSGSSKHLIVTGTYGSCTLPDVDDVQQPLFLDLPDSIPVPLYYWKLYYDLESDNGTVYIGLNNPYMEIDDSTYICPNVCPGEFGNDDDDDEDNDGDEDDDGDDGDGDDDDDANNGLIYCCTKESFEEVYGQLDPIVYRQV